MRSQAGLPCGSDALCTVPIPLLRMLEETLSGLQFEQQTRRTAIVAYTDDVTLHDITGGFPSNTGRHTLL